MVLTKACQEDYHTLVVQLEVADYTIRREQVTVLKKNVLVAAERMIVHIQNVEVVLIGKGDIFQE